MGNAAQGRRSLEAELTRLVGELYESFAAGGALSAGEQAAALQNYIRRVARIGIAAGGAGHVGLKEACVAFQQSLKALQADTAPLDATLQALLEEWPLRVATCLAAPRMPEAADALVELLGNHRLPSALNAADGALLRATLLGTAANAGPAGQEAAPPPGPQERAATEPSFDRDLLDALQDEVSATRDALVDAFRVETPVEDRSTALELCADRVELLGMAAAAGGLTGLMDICMLFRVALAEVLPQAHTLDRAEADALVEWSSHVAAYLEEPWDSLRVDTLLENLSRLPHAPTLAHEEQVLLSGLLLLEDAPAPETTGQVDTQALEPLDVHPMGPVGGPSRARADTDSQPDEAMAAAAGEPPQVPTEPGTHPATHPATALATDPPPDEPLAEQPDAAESEPAGGDALSISDEARELLDLLLLELEDTAATVQTAGTALMQANAGERAAAARRYAELLDPLAAVSASLGLDALHEALIHLQTQAAALRTPDESIDAALGALLVAWPGHIAHYLRALGSAPASRALADYLAHGRWPQPLSADAAQALAAALRSPQLHAEDDNSTPRARKADAEDVSLELPEDANPQLLESLLQELPAETAEFTEAVTLLHQGRATLADLDRAQRIAHTLKGSANTVGVPGIANLTHHIEDILLAYSRQKRLPGRTLAEVLMDAADVLEMMSETLLGTSTAPAQAQTVLQQILDWANRIDHEGLPGEDDDALSDRPAIAPEAAASTTRPEAADADTTTPMLRVPATLVDELLRRAGESLILGGQLDDRLEQARRQSEMVRAQNIAMQALAAELEQLIDVRGLTAAGGHGRQDDFDALELEQYNELHTLTHRLVEAATDARELTGSVEDLLEEIGELTGDQSRLQREQQETIMRTRMVPAQQLVPRLQRSVRQTCRLTGTQAQLEVLGAETLLDSDVLAELADPLMHILRNAVDHGIEAEAARQAAGKPRCGRVTLEFAREGDQVAVRCTDDGAGLDLDAIRKRAIERGLLAADADPDPAELARFVWLSGFTTRDTTTQTSGRGIGMDAVHGRILDLKGSLRIDSLAGGGCTVELRLPLTLMSVHGLLVRAGGQVLALSSRGIEQVLHPEEGARERDGHRLHYRLGDALHEAFYIESLLHQPLDALGADREPRPALLVRDETGGTHVVLVGQVLASQDLVVKQLGRYLPPIAGIEGATILGDGSVAPVLDLPGLLRTRNRDDLAGSAEQVPAEAASAPLPCALVVDDSLSARRSLAQFLHDVGYDVRTARDGLEAIEVIEERLPDIVLVDLEMPRMNGLEFAAHLRGRECTRELPILMVTSRSTEKHRRQAQAAGVDAYFTKPFAEDELLGHIEARLAGQLQ